MDISFEKDDRGVKVHKVGVIAQLCAPYRSHEQGLPEWCKNSAAAYARSNVPTEHRVLTLMFGRRPADDLPYIALLDHGGMSVQDVEDRFADWGNPEAHISETDTDEVVEGGHGNGGKCYMTQMFEHSSYIHTVKDGPNGLRCSRYGFVGDDPHPGYFPDKARGRGVPVSGTKEELGRALADLGVKLKDLPSDVLATIAARDGFTLVVGLKPKNFGGRDAWRKLVEEALIDHPQMALTMQTNRVFVVNNGRAVDDLSPVRLAEIQPHKFAPEPRIVILPDELLDPVTGEPCLMNPAGAPKGKLIIQTSAVSMRWKKKGLHHIRYVAHGRPLAFLPMSEVSRSYWGDRMYGECHLDQLTSFETNDRRVLAEAPLTRALEAWVKEQVAEYESEFKKRERLEASQEQQNKLQKLNDYFDRWKNHFLEDSDFHSGNLAGPGTPKPRPRPRPLPATAPASVYVKCPHAKAGVGVWLRLQPEFHDSTGNRVAAPAYLWHSSDWAVATVDQQEGIVTHTPGVVELWVETIDGKLRSDPIQIEVIDTVRAVIEPPTLEVTAGTFHQLSVSVTDRSGVEHSDVLMTWVQDDSSIVSVTASGKVIGRKPGATPVYAMDDQCVDAAGACHVTVVAAEAGPGDTSGKGYPRILMSEIDPDPLHPDGLPYNLSPQDGPVHQPTPQHVQHNIWFINLQCPLARMLFEHYGPDSTQWRSYHLERYIEALAKIRLNRAYQVEEHLSFDEIERSWREIASEVQTRALEDLRALLEGGELPEA